MTDKTKHTPGPWKLDIFAGKVIGITRDNDKGGDKYAPNIAQMVYMGENTELDSPTVEANAQLIATAPEMLEALKEIARRRAYVFSDDIEWLETVIAKAEGRAE